MNSQELWDIFETTGDIEFYSMYVTMKEEEKGEKECPTNSKPKR